jgi:hypothetical protein
MQEWKEDKDDQPIKYDKEIFNTEDDDWSD